MSAHSEILQPLPSPEIYTEAYRIVDEHFESDSGIAFELMKRSLDALEDPQQKQDEDRALQVASVLSYDPASPEIEDQIRPAAFVNGYFATVPVVNLAYRGNVSLEARHRPIENWNRRPLSFSSEVAVDQRILRQVRLIKLSSFGLKVIGEEAQTILDKWSYEMYPNAEDLAEIFRIGSGVLLAGSLIRQSGVNNATIIHETSGGSLDDELQSLNRMESRNDDF